jgi:predicted amidohydrolase
VTDLAIVGGRVVDPARGIDGSLGVAITGGRLTGLGEVGPATETIDASGLVLVPGLIDLHTHLYHGVSHYGIDPDANCLRRGVTTAVDAGSAGAQTFPGFRRYVIERAQTRILAFLHVAVQGMITPLVGELEDLRWASPAQAIGRAREHPDLIVGVKVRLGYQMVGNDPEPALMLARQASEQLGLPLMVHIIDMRRPIGWLLPHLGQGDIVTHCFHANEGGILDPDGRLHPEVARARARGVLFDVGHGAGSFAYRVARAALAQDFPPDTVSSDLHAHNVAGPVYDQATTLSKLLHCGMSLAEVVRSATAAPAAAIRRAGEIGSLAPGSMADLTCFELRTGGWALPDGAGQSEVVEMLVIPRLVVRAGRAHRLDPVIPGPVPLAGSAHERGPAPARAVAPWSRSADTLAVTGGTVLTPGGTRQADVVIRHGKIIALADAGAAPAHAERLDAAGCLVLPGGVDPHCHIMTDVAAATRAAALGGTTTVLSFTNPQPGEGAVACLLRRRDELAAAHPVVDVGLHAMLYAPDQVAMADLQALRDAGVSGIKIFLAYPELGIMWSTRGLFELMTAAARQGQVVQVHCEDGQMIDGLVAAAIASGRTGARLFAETRPPEAEAASVALVLGTAGITGAAVYLTHLSCSQTLDQVRLARHRGSPALYGEACLHHLLLDDRCYQRTDAERYLVAPPLRPPGHPEALWQALADGTLDTVGSDHCQERSRSVGELAPDGRGYRYGIAGVGARLPLLLSRGLARGLPIERLAEVASANPARAFGHYPRKGALAPGSDADLLIWDPAAEMTIAADTFDDGTGDSVYVGERLSGQVRDVLLGGRALVRQGRFVAEGAGGTYLSSPG